MAKTTTKSNSNSNSKSKSNTTTVTASKDGTTKTKKSKTAEEIYIDSLKKQQAQNESYINSSYGALISSAYAKKHGINAQADQSFRDTYSTSRVSALGNNEVLSTKGLAGNAYDQARSGYSESSRISQDNALHKNLGVVRVARDSSLADVDTEIMGLEHKRNQELMNNSNSYGELISKSYYDAQKSKSEQNERDRDQANKDRDYQLKLEKQKADKKSADEKFNYQKLLDKQKQKNWEKEQALKEKTFNYNSTKTIGKGSSGKGSSGKGSSSKYSPKSTSNKGNSNASYTNNGSTTAANDHNKKANSMSTSDKKKYDATAIRPSADNYYSFMINPQNFGNKPQPRVEYLNSLLKSKHINQNEYEYLGKRLGFTIRPNGTINY